ncbi:heme biosynthesis HemY N-terminal domain-containing protein [Thalassotalea ponticola]|uniref:heme biosynthesis HemY N-terminal domain-containing protein n=1 Tax=Thalassotalea ponticola TaxID=1523392 RepID=UPI0025B345CB|nr:heme biosynthesis HemY N-terminal domain-containing protein [Thalassotalea ponticola]MDN3652772.1 heme biosynthesis HemY N-terminal domain-containing protein [Thalassotalea ponticola]
MKKILLVLALLTAIAVAPFLIDEKGYILIAMGNLTIEMTVVSALLMLVIGTIVGLLLISIIRFGWKMTSSTWRKLLFSNEAKANKAFQQGLGAYLLGDYQNAETLLANSAEKVQFSNTAWLFAAKSSDALNNNANTQNYLQLLVEHPDAKQDFSIESLLLTAKLQMQLGYFDKARQLLNDNHTLIGHDTRLIALDIDINTALDNYNAALDGLKRLRKRKDISTETLYELEYAAYKGLYDQLTRDKSIDAVSSHYQSLSRKEKQSEGVVLAYADTLIANGLSKDFEGLVLPHINRKSSTHFINALKTLPVRHAQHVIDSIQKLLQKNPDNPVWLSALAHLCYADKQIDKAQKAFVSLFKIRRDKADLLTYARLLEEQGEHQQANRIYRELN